MVTAGDPFGIGPEIVASALADEAVHRLADWTVFAPRSVMTLACRLIDRTFDSLGVALIEPEPTLPRSSEPLGLRDPDIAGKLSFSQVERAIDAVKRHDGPCGLVTAPISKSAWHGAGHDEHPGHTELLAERFGVDRAVMMFVGPTLRVSLVTVHLPLAEAIRAITPALVQETIERTAEAMVMLGRPAPRIGVCGLNPHAGEGGLLGEEDARLIAPAVEAAREAGIDASGPYPADALFTKAASGSGAGGVDAVVAMYHDQGLIPAKVLDRDKAVNVTLGLGPPGAWAVRTSPAHGTAFDIAWQGVASADSMKAAMRLAAEMASGSVRA